jgi:hypothetical protein
VRQVTTDRLTNRKAHLCTAESNIGTQFVDVLFTRLVQFWFQPDILRLGERDRVNVLTDHQERETEPTRRERQAEGDNVYLDKDLPQTDGGCAELSHKHHALEVISLAAPQELQTKITRTTNE